MKCWPKIQEIPEQNVFLFGFDDDKIKILPPVHTCSCHPASHLLHSRVQPELTIALGKADHQKIWYKMGSLQTIPRQPGIAHTNSLSLSGQIQTFQLVLNGIILTWLHNKCLSLWVRLWPHRLVRVCNYPKMYSCQQHTIFNTSLAFRVKLTLHSQILPPRQLYPNWDFRDFISRESRSLHLWF